MKLVKRLLVRNGLNVQLSLIEIVLRLQLVMLYPFLWYSELTELSDLVKESFVVIKVELCPD